MQKLFADFVLKIARSGDWAYRMARGYARPTTTGTNSGVLRTATDRLTMGGMLLFLLGMVCMTAQGQLPGVLPGASPSAPPPAPAAAAPAAAPASSEAAPISGFVADETYQLRAGDTVSFQILEDRLLDITNNPQSLLVADSGELDAPYIGRVMAAGKTCKQLAVDIKTALEKDYYKQATVVLSLNLANRAWGRIYLLGQVHVQGALDVQVNENLTAGRAILRAGGFADFANKKKVKVIRTGENGENKTFELDMEQILEKGKIDKDIALQPGDLIVVPSRLINF